MRVDKQPWGLFQEVVLTQLIFGRRFSACNRIIIILLHNDIILLQLLEFFSLLFSCANKGCCILILNGIVKVN